MQGLKRNSFPKNFQFRKFQAYGFLKNLRFFEPFLIIFVVENLRKPIGIAYISETMENDALASSLSSESQINSIIAAALSLGFGYLADLAGIGTGLLIPSLVLLILAFVIFSLN